MTLTSPSASEGRGPWPTDAPTLVRGYRRVVPLPVRRAVVAVTRPGLRHSAIRSMTRLSESSGALRLRLAHRQLRTAGLLAGDGERLAVATRRGVYVAAVMPHLTPLAARAENLRLVCEALQAADVDHFVVRCYSNVASAVGVRAEDRTRVTYALADLCAREGGYVSEPRRRAGAVLAAPTGDLRRAWRRLAEAPVVRFTLFQSSPDGRLVLGWTHGCDVEFWEHGDDEEEATAGRLLAPRPNRATESVPDEAPAVEAPAALFTRLSPADGGPERPTLATRPEFAVRLPDEVRFPIDVVYTWVDGADPEWQRRRATVTETGYHEQAANAARYLNRDELRYSLRSLHLYAPWVRHIYLVTDRQVPAWLSHAHPGLTIVDHTEIFDDPDVLPTFNSHAIETRLHHIHGLSEHFLYFNDDVFLGSPVVPQDFFLANGMTKFFLSRALVPLGSPESWDVPVSAAGKNNRALLEGRFGTTLTQKLKHTPHALRRSVLAEIEQEFPDPYLATMASRVRSASDVSLPSALHHYYAFQTGRAVPGKLRYDYFDLAGPAVPARLARLLRTRRHQAFCLNDTVSSEQETTDRLDLIRPFLDAYFPVQGPLERATARQEARQPCLSPSHSR